MTARVGMRTTDGVHEQDDTPSARRALRLGLAGFPIAHSLSPRMHQAGLDALGVAGRYELRPTQPEEVSDLIRELREGRWDGVNITTPLKTDVVPFVEGDPIVRRCGAANTIWPKDGVLRAALTDVDGVREPLERRGVSGGEALILGAGGASRAAALALEQLGMRVSAAARDAAKAAEVVQFVRPEQRGEGLSLASCAAPGALKQTSVIVQATSVGRGGESLALDWESAPPSLVAFEMLYTPRETAFLKSARAHGLQIVEGWEMLLAQGVRSFGLWLDVEPPVDVMRAALLSGL